MAGLAGGVLGVESCTDDGVGPAGPMPAVTAAAALAFQQVSSGDIHTCGVTTGSKAYCWGWNQQGQLGDGSRTERGRPTLVKGGLLFRQISSGQAHTCGITTDNKAYCWGDNFFGQLGNGTESAEPTKVPVAVAGTRRWRQVSVGSYHTCGIAMDDRAFCWGDNHLAQIGTGSFSSTPKLMPTAVSGGLLFRQLSTALFHTCAVTLDDRAYCWGGDQWGQIGDGAGSSTCSHLLGGQGICRGEDQYCCDQRSRKAHVGLRAGGVSLGLPANSDGGRLVHVLQIGTQTGNRHAICGEGRQLAS